MDNSVGRGADGNDARLVADLDRLRDLVISLTALIFFSIFGGASTFCNWYRFHLKNTPFKGQLFFDDRGLACLVLLRAEDLLRNQGIYRVFF